MPDILKSKTHFELLTEELRSAVQLLAVIRRAREADEWLDAEVFAEILVVGMRRAGVSASDLANAEKVSRSAVSKWVNREAIPAVPTRKTILSWIKDTLEARKEALQSKIEELYPRGFVSEREEVG